MSKPVIYIAAESRNYGEESQQFLDKDYYQLENAGLRDSHGGWGVHHEAGDIVYDRYGNLQKHYNIPPVRELSNEQLLTHATEISANLGKLYGRSFPVGFLESYPTQFNAAINMKDVLSNSVELGINNPEDRNALLNDINDLYNQILPETSKKDFSNSQIFVDALSTSVISYTPEVFYIGNPNPTGTKEHPRYGVPWGEKVGESKKMKREFEKAGYDVRVIPVYGEEDNVAFWEEVAKDTHKDSKVVLTGHTGTSEAKFLGVESYNWGRVKNTLYDKGITVNRDVFIASCGTGGRCDISKAIYERSPTEKVDPADLKDYVFSQIKDMEYQEDARMPLHYTQPSGSASKLIELERKYGGNVNLEHLIQTAFGDIPGYNFGGHIITRETIPEGILDISGGDVTTYEHKEWRGVVPAEAGLTGNEAIERMLFSYQLDPLTKRGRILDPKEQERAVVTLQQGELDEDVLLNDIINVVFEQDIDFSDMGRFEKMDVLDDLFERERSPKEQYNIIKSDPEARKILQTMQPINNIFNIIDNQFN